MCISVLIGIIFTQLRNMTLIITSDITGAIMHAYEAVKQAHQLLTSLQQDQAKELNYYNS